MISPQATREGGSRSGGRVPRPSPLRSNYLSDDAPDLSVRLTSLGLALAGVLLALVFCAVIWVTLWLLGAGYFIVALATVCAALLVAGITTSIRK